MYTPNPSKLASHLPRLFIALSTGFFFISHADSAIQAVNWGGAYVDNDERFADDVLANRSGSDNYGDPDGPFSIGLGGADTLVGRGFNSSTPWSPGAGVYDGASDTFYGGGSVTVMGHPTNDGFTELTILNQGPNDSIHYHVDTGHDNHTFHLAMFWDKADFLGGLSSTPNLSFGNGLFTMTTAQSSGHHTDELLRWMVRDGSQFYISEGTITISNNSNYSVAMSTLTNWAAYNPNEATAGSATSADLLSIDFDELGPYTAQSFTDITAVGYYVEHEAATGPVHVHIENFGASLVPEPSAPILIGFAATVVFLRRQRRMA